MLFRSIQEFSGDVESLGTLADLYVELGDYENASIFYDEVIKAIHLEDESSAEPMVSSWDC